MHLNDKEDLFAFVLVDSLLFRFKGRVRMNGS